MLKVTIYLQIGNFLQILSESDNRNVISNVKKRLLKKIVKCWRRNGGFTFWPEVKVTHLIDIRQRCLLESIFSLEGYTLKS